MTNTASPVPFPPYRVYGAPSPSGAVARIVEGPLSEPLAAAFDEAVTASFALGRDPLVDGGPAWEASQEAVRVLGRALLGDDGLVDDVTCSCGDGPGEGDVWGALAVLADIGDVELGPALVAQLRARGTVVGW